MNASSAFPPKGTPPAAPETGRTGNLSPDATVDQGAPAGQPGTVDYQSPPESTCDQPPAPVGTCDYVSAPAAGEAAAPPNPSPPGAAGAPAPVGTCDYASAPEGSKAAAPPKRRRELPTIPGYEIERELGRGGMGVVYKARQTRLNRPVALKMVLAGAHATPQQLARFDREARAVARLQHRNIVQIYEIGELDGLPYFSLEYVDGGTLAQHIARQPQPPRVAAELVETLARVMSFAHDQNIIHRDLKPANILLARALPQEPGSISVEPGRTQLPSITKTLSSATVPAVAALVPKVTDFGLAKAVEEVGEEQTASGAVMGTPSYMAPEQARGDTAAIGQLSDQYALGAILYELLTGRPPFAGSSMLDTLDQVRTREPVPPTELQPKVPADLETICLKCLQKEPGKRYAGCADLADDLGRFLTGHPIHARPVSVAERLSRWCRRNPKVAFLSAASVLLLVLAVVVSLWAAFDTAAKNKVIEREKEAAVQSTAEAVAARKVAEDNDRLATEQATVALGTIQALIDKVQKRLDEAPGTQELKRDLLETALGCVQQVSKRAEGATSIAPTRAAAHMQLGQLFQQLGKSQEALAEFHKVYEITKARVVLKQGSDASRRNLAAALMMLADMDRELGRDMRASLAHCKEALALWEDIDRNPKADDKGEGLASRVEVLDGVAELSTRVGATYLRLGDPAQAAGYFRKALANRRELANLPADKLEQPQFALGYRLGLARSLLAIGDTSFRIDDRSTAVASFDECLRIVEELYAQKPNIRALKQELARACTLIGDFHLRGGETEMARPLYERALALSRELAAADPKKFEYQWDLGHTHYRQGLLALRANDGAGARGHFESCRAVREKLAAQDRANDRRRMELMLALAHCGQHAEADGIARRLLGGVTDAEMLMDHPAVARSGP
jgi:serine/threonine-protein kinase